MKKIVLLLLLLVPIFVMAQKSIRDESITYQQERMVFKQWDRNKFTPTSGWLGLNPYYWLTWGLHPNYPKTDLRPLSATGPQTLRLGAVGLMRQSDANLEKETDTLSNSALAEIYNHSAIFSGTDPLWLLYYSKQFKGLTEFNSTKTLMDFPPKVSAKLISEGSLGWLENEIHSLQERLSATRASDQDRGSRILSYHRLLGELRKLMGLWNARTATALKAMNKVTLQKKLQSQEVTIDSWSADSDVKIAIEVLRGRKY